MRLTTNLCQQGVIASSVMSRDVVAGSMINLLPYSTLLDTRLLLLSTTSSLKMLRLVLSLAFRSAIFAITLLSMNRRKPGEPDDK